MINRFQITSNRSAFRKHRRHLFLDVFVDGSYSDVAVEAVYDKVVRDSQDEYDKVGRRQTLKIVNVRTAGENVSVLNKI